MEELSSYIAQLKTEPALAAMLEPLLTLIEQQAARIEALESEVVVLKARLDQNSQNSHKPPSSDGYSKPKPAFVKLKRRKRGGQKGHRGDTLNMTATPDEVIDCHPARCRWCQHQFEPADRASYQRRQVFDLPLPKLYVREYRSYRRCCSECGQHTQASFPDHVQAPVQYGRKVGAFTALLNNSYHLPWRKIGQLFFDLFGQRFNEASVQAANLRCYHRLAAVEQQIRSAVASSAVAHFDETGLRVSDKLAWVHVASTKRWTYYYVHHRRGSAALRDGPSVLPNFSGVAIHDCWASYFRFTSCGHGLCLAHLIREVRAVLEQTGADWAKELIALFMEAYRYKQKQSVLTQTQRHQCKQRYFALLREGLHAHQSSKRHQKRGRVKQSKARNLLLRLKRHHGAVWAFATEAEVPFTNNQAERDLRMVKLKGKVIGGFRSEQGAAVFARIQGFCSSLRKQGKQVFKELCEAMQDPNYSLKNDT